MTTQFWSAVSVIVIIVPAAILMIWGWHRRVRRQRDAVAALPEAPAFIEDASTHRGKYVATTTAGDPYDRIAARGLAFRGFATVAVAPAGVLVARDGEPDVWIPASAIVAIDRATWTIDRVVEVRGLHLIRWRLGDREFDTYLRLDESGLLDEALHAAGLPVRQLEIPPSAIDRRRAARSARREASTT